jgi:hypothetical protein
MRTRPSTFPIVNARSCSFRAGSLSLDSVWSKFSFRNGDPWFANWGHSLLLSSPF